MHSNITSMKRKCESVTTLCTSLKKKCGPYSYNTMRAAGFDYTNNKDTACCRKCGLEVSSLTAETKPFAIHKERMPTCPYVLSIMPAIKNPTGQSLTSTDGEPPSKRLKTSPIDPKTQVNTLFEVNSLKEIRKRTFSHWPRESLPSLAQMIQAGFFCCNVGDRVICIYCNLICQQWTPNNDDNPSKVHKTLSPKCPYVKGVLAVPQTSPSNEETTSTNLDSPSISFHLAKTAHHKKYIESEKRLESFSTCPDKSMPPVDDLVRAGFYYTGTRTVTCFYCNGSLQNWGDNDNPLIEHTRWFPQCAYAKHLYGAEARQKRQESKRPLQGLFLRGCLLLTRNCNLEKIGTNNSNIALKTDRDGSNENGAFELDQDAWEHSLKARLDLPLSRGRINEQYKLPMIKKCWEDQLQVKCIPSSSSFEVNMNHAYLFFRF